LIVYHFRETDGLVQIVAVLHAARAIPSVLKIDKLEVLKETLFLN
jgi:hypothetical protein